MRYININSLSLSLKILGGLEKRTAFLLNYPENVIIVSFAPKLFIFQTFC